MYNKPISYSGKSLYKKCPAQWKDNYIDGNRGEGNAASERGTALHLKLEEFFLGGPYPSGDKCLSKWQKYMEELATHNPSAEAEVAVDKEWNQVSFDDKTGHFRGKKDLDILGAGVKKIYDWKSGKIYPDHVYQGQAYTALDATEAGEYEVTFVYLDIPLHTQVWNYSQAQKAKFREGIDKEIQVIRLDEEWKPNPGDHCHWCRLNWRNRGSCTAAP